MATVILGGGIIGFSTAYYLSEPELSGGKQGSEIHTVDTSSELFASASGYSAGFIARDWFSPDLESLGALSFDLHRKLAEENDGREKWGYMESTPVALQVSREGHRKTGGEGDWLQRGDSRAEVASGTAERDANDPSPLWLTEQPGGVVQKISDNSSAAQVDPLRLSQFLMNKCIERGVKVHYPARAIRLTKDLSGTTTGLDIEHLDTKNISHLACANLVLAAGVWTARVFASLFPGSHTTIPVSGLPGYSLVLRSPRHDLTHERERYSGKSHAVFTSNPHSVGFSPEIFSRSGGEIYISGLNAPELRPPNLATDSRHLMETEKSAKLKRAAVSLMGKRGAQIENEDDLEVIREGLCFRPLTRSGIPIVSKLPKPALGDDNIVPASGTYMGVGHGPWGISLSLGTGKVLAEMIAGVNPSADISALGL